MGDIICGLPAFSALHEKYPDAELTWITLPQYCSLLPSYTRIITSYIEPFGHIPDDIPHDLLINAQPMWRHQEWQATKKHVIDLIAMWSGVTLKHRTITIIISKSDIDYVNSLKLPDKPFVAMCSSPCYSWQSWPLQHRNILCGMLRCSGIPVVTIGGKDGVQLDNAISYHGQLTPTQTIALINKSKIYIGPDNGCSWLACATNTPKICILNRQRLMIGTVGYQGYVDGDIIDLFDDITINKQYNAIMMRYNY